MAAAISNDELFPAIHRVLGKRFLTCYERQLKGNISNENALILLDNSSSHINESVNILCTMHNILLLSFPPHSSHILQPLDLLLFSLVKKRSYGMTTYNGYSDTTIRILNIVNSIHKAGIPHLVRLSFVQFSLMLKIGPILKQPLTVFNLNGTN